MVRRAIVAALAVSGSVSAFSASLTGGVSAFRRRWRSGVALDRGVGCTAAGARAERRGASRGRGKQRGAASSLPGSQTPSADERSSTGG